MATDIFGKELITPTSPLTADRAIIMLGGKVVAGAMNFQLNYSQGVNTRRAIGNKYAVINTTQPQGQISIAYLTSSATLPGAVDGGLPCFATGMWTSCDFTNPAERELTFEFPIGSCVTNGDVDVSNIARNHSFTATGCVITMLNVATDAESNFLAEGVQISFLQLIGNGCDFLGNGPAIG